LTDFVGLALGLGLGEPDGFADEEPPEAEAEGEGFAVEPPLLVPEPALSVAFDVAPESLAPSLESLESLESFEVLVGELVALAPGLAEGDGESDCVTHGPGAKGLLGSSAWARCGVIPMPMRTAVGMAASATALPAGTCSLVSNDLRGAAWRGPEDARVLTPSPAAG